MPFKKILPLLLVGVFFAAPLGGTLVDPVQAMETNVKITSVELVTQPMVYVTATVSMAEIPQFMGTAFETLGQFLGVSGVRPLGAPLAVYRDWSGENSVVDVGFPVSAEDAKKAGGKVLAGDDTRRPRAQGGACGAL